MAVDRKICTHLETGLAYDIASGKVSDTPTREDYFTAGALKDDQVDYVMNNVGFSAELCDLMCAYNPEFMKNYENREDQIGGTIREIQAVGPTSFELVIMGIVYCKADRDRTMGHMTAALPDMDGGMQALARQKIRRLEAMTDADFEDMRFLFTND